MLCARMATRSSSRNVEIIALTAVAWSTESSANMEPLASIIKKRSAGVTVIKLAFEVRFTWWVRLTKEITVLFTWTLLL